jgi:hypothetical protein
LTFGGIPAGACYAGGEHDFSSALTYSIPRDNVPDGAQPGWQRCSECQLLGFSQFAPAPCPAGEAHDYSGSDPYSVYPESLVNGQPGWRKCGKCNAMTFTQLSHGLCRDGSPHDVSTGDSYTIPLGAVPIGAESSWRRCSRCQVLAYGGISRGVCFDGGLHDLGESPLYGVPIESPPEGAQAGWRRCARCQELVFGESEGLCAGGVTHDLTDSLAYSIAFIAPVAPLPAGPRLMLTESEASIVVHGNGFRSGTSVELSYIVGASSLKVAPTVDEQGVFEHTVDQVVAAATGGLVIARWDSGEVASGRLRSFVPAPAVLQG